MSVFRSALTLTIPAVAVLLLSGCSGQTDSAAEPEQSPLSVYLSAIYGGGVVDEKEQQAQLDEQNKKREALVASCMSEQGFEYTPDAHISAAVMSSGEEWKPDDREWVAQYGYGISRFPGSDAPAPEDTYVDPNADYVATLSESEQAAYYEALYGVTPDNSAPSGDETYEYDWTKAGCQGAAEHEISGEDPLQSDQFQPLMNALNSFWTDTAAWPGMAAVDGDWAACMEEAGYPGLHKQTDASTSISDAYSAAWQKVGPEASGPDEATLAQLSKTEIDTALADLDCRATTDYAARSKKAQWAAEEQFISDHKADLEAAKAAAAQARS